MRLAKKMIEDAKFKNGKIIDDLLINRLSVPDGALRPKGYFAINNSSLLSTFSTLITYIIFNAV